MATTQQLTVTVNDQHEDPMPDEDVTYTSDDTDIATVNSSGLVTGVSEGETFIRVASVTDPTKYTDVPVTVTAEGSGSGSASLTSVGNGFRCGLNFSDVGITNGTTIRAAIVGTFGGVAPAAGNWSLVTDDATYGKVARLTLPPGDFALPLAGLADTLVSNARVRVLVRFNDFTGAALNSQGFFRLRNYQADPNKHVSTEVESSGDMSIKAINLGVASLTTVTSAGTTLRDALVDGGWKELILECKDNENNTITNNYVQVTPGASRTPALTRTSSSGDYPGANVLQFDGFEILNPYLNSSGATIDFALIESCNPYDGGGDLIPLSALGT